MLRPENHSFRVCGELPLFSSGHSSLQLLSSSFLASKSWSPFLILGLGIFSQLPLCMEKKDSLPLWPQVHLGLQVHSHLNLMVFQDPIHAMSGTSLSDSGSPAQLYPKLDQLICYSRPSSLFFIHAKAPSRFHPEAPPGAPASLPAPSLAQMASKGL